MVAATPLHRQQRRTSYDVGPHEENTIDEYSTIFSDRDYTRFPAVVSRKRSQDYRNVPPDTRTRVTPPGPQTTFVTRAAAAGRCIVNGLIIAVIVTVAIAFLGSICIGVFLLVKPSPSSLQESTFITVPNNMFNDDNTFSLQYDSTRNGSIHTDDDVFIMDRFPTPQPTRVPTVKPTKSPTITERPTTTVPIVETNSSSIANLTAQFRDGKNATKDSSTPTNSTNTTVASSNSSTVFTFDDDGKTINNDDPFGGNIPKGNVDDVALGTPNTADATTSQKSPCTSSNCKTFLDDVLNNVLATKAIDDVVKGNGDVKASNTDDSLQNVAPRNWPKQANFSQDDGLNNDGPAGDDFWNDVADDNRLKSQSLTGGNFASLTTKPNQSTDAKHDDVLLQTGKPNTASKVSNTGKGNDDLIQSDDNLKASSSFQQSSMNTGDFSSSNFVKVKNVDNTAKGDDDQTKSDDDLNTKSTFKGSHPTTNNFSNSNAANVQNADDTAKVDDDPTKSVDDLNTISTFKGSHPTTNKFSNSDKAKVQHDDGNTKGVSLDPNVNVDSSTDDFKNDNFVSSNKKANQGDDFQGVTSQNSHFANGAGSTKTVVNTKNSGTSNGFQNDNFVASNTNSDFAHSMGTTTAGGSSKISDDFATGDDRSATFKGASVSTPSTDDQWLDDATQGSATTSSIPMRVRTTSMPSVAKKTAKKAKGDSSPTTTPTPQPGAVGSSPLILPTSEPSVGKKKKGG